VRRTATFGAVPPGNMLDPMLHDRIKREQRQIGNALKRHERALRGHIAAV
jgi:hypothetical protein